MWAELRKAEEPGSAIRATSVTSGASVKMGEQMPKERLAVGVIPKNLVRPTIKPILIPRPGYEGSLQN